MARRARAAGFEGSAAGIRHMGLVVRRVEVLAVPASVKEQRISTCVKRMGILENLRRECDRRTNSTIAHFAG